MQLHAVTYLVDDYDRAIEFFVRCLGFALLEDTQISVTKRWVRVGDQRGGTCLLLAKADGPEQVDAVRKAAGGRVAYFVYTADFVSDHARMLRAGVNFRGEPRHEAYGTVAVFDDLYGNGWDLIEPSQR